MLILVMPGSGLGPKRDSAVFRRSSVSRFSPKASVGEYRMRMKEETCTM